MQINLNQIKSFLNNIDNYRSFLHPDELNKASVIAEMCRKMNFLKPNELHIGILGSFKAGKSTLVNAMLQKDIAAMDDMELTASTCIFHPSSDQNVIVEMETGTRHSLGYEQWREKANSVRKDPTWWQSVSHCEIPVETSFPYTIIDTPGLGVITQGREKQAKSALTMCDVIIWVLSVENLGEAEEGRLLRNVQQTGIPIVLALNQIDLVDADDIPELVEFVEDMFPWSCDRIFPVSALQELQGKAHNSGVNALRKHLEQLDKDPLGLRIQSQLAQKKLLVQEWSLLRKSILSNISNEIDHQKHKVNIIQNKGKLILEQIKLELHNKIFNDFLSDVEQRLLSIGSKNPLEIQNELRNSMSSHTDRKTISEFLDKVPNMMGERWGTTYQELAEELDLSLSVLEQRFQSKCKEFPIAIEQYQVFEQDRTLEQGAAITAAAVTGAGAVAWLGPGAAAISFGTALSVVALPVILAGGGLLFAKSLLNKKNESNLKDQMVYMAVNNVRQSVWDKYIEVDVIPRLNDMHQSIQNTIMGLMIDAEMEQKIALRNLLQNESTSVELHKEN